MTKRRMRCPRLRLPGAQTAYCTWLVIDKDEAEVVLRGRDSEFERVAPRSVRRRSLPRHKPLRGVSVRVRGNGGRSVGAQRGGVGAMVGGGVRGTCGVCGD